MLNDQPHLGNEFDCIVTRAGQKVKWVKLFELDSYIHFIK